jgi:hypothetical protein
MLTSIDWYFYPGPSNKKEEVVSWDKTLHERCGSSSTKKDLMQPMKKRGRKERKISQEEIFWKLLKQV